MHVTVKQSGGYAGITTEIASLATAKSGPKGEKIAQLLKQSDFFNLPASTAGSDVGADFLEYEITASEGGRSNSIRFRDDNSPQTAPLRSLVQAIVGA